MSLERKTPLKRSVWLPPRTRLRQKSAKQAKKDREFAAVRKEVLERDGYQCQMAKVIDGHHCDWRGLEVHHIHQRSQGGDHDQVQLVSICGAAHDWCHSNIREAELFGFLVSDKWRAIRECELEAGAVSVTEETPQ